MQPAQPSFQLIQDSFVHSQTSVTFTCLRYARAPDGKGLIAFQYDERFKLGQVDGDDIKALRKRVIDTIAQFAMSEVTA